MSLNGFQERWSHSERLVRPIRAGSAADRTDSPAPDCLSILLAFCHVRFLLSMLTSSLRLSQSTSQHSRTADLVYRQQLFITAFPSGGGVEKQWSTASCTPPALLHPRNFTYESTAMPYSSALHTALTAVSRRSHTAPSNQEDHPGLGPVHTLDAARQKTYRAAQRCGIGGVVMQSIDALPHFCA